MSLVHLSSHQPDNDPRAVDIISILILEMQKQDKFEVSKW